MTNDNSNFPSSFPPTENDIDFNFNPISNTSDLTFTMDEDQDSNPLYKSEVKIFNDFLRNHTCYEMIPASGKIVVLDVSLVIKVAFRALIENRIKSAPLWDSSLSDFVGMITVTDFIDIVRYLYSNKDITKEDKQIKEWREILPNSYSDLISIHPDESIYDAAQSLITNRVHRIPIIDKEDNNSILHILSHHRILVFLISNIQDNTREELLKRSISDLGIGTFNNVVTVFKEMSLIFVLNLLSERTISTVPLVDETGIIDGLYSKSDAANLAKYPDIISLLDKPVAQFIEKKRVYTCKKSDTLQKVLVEIMLGCDTRQVICVDGTNRVIGIISQSDILRFFLSNS